MINKFGLNSPSYQLISLLSLDFANGLGASSSELGFFGSLSSQCFVTAYFSISRLGASP
jgi:hypothetical protein